MYIYLFIYTLSIYLFIYLSIYLYLSVTYLENNLSFLTHRIVLLNSIPSVLGLYLVCIYIHYMYFYLFIYTPSIYIFIYLSIYLENNLSFWTQRIVLLNSIPSVLGLASDSRICPYSSLKTKHRINNWSQLANVVKFQ